MIMKTVLLAVIMLGICGGEVLAQKKKEIKKNKIRAMAVYSSDAGGKEFREFYTKYDANGNVIEEGEFKNDGSILRKEVNKYDKNNDQIEHIVYAGPSIKKKVTSSYNAMGDKVTEIDYDDKGNVIRKSVYTYDKRGLKQEKKVYDGKGNLIVMKRFNYEF